MAEHQVQKDKGTQSVLYINLLPNFWGQNALFAPYCLLGGHSRDFALVSAVRTKNLVK